MMMSLYRHMTLITSSIVAAVAFFAGCMHIQAGEDNDVRGEFFAGAATCASCHRGVHDSALASPHMLSTRPATRDAIKGSFTPPANTFEYNGDRKVIMQAREDGLYQIGMAGGVVQDEHRFDLVMGSGRKGQTFLYWQGDSVAQLPVSWFRLAGGWANSPHYPMDTIWFGRVVPFECFACHTAYIKIKRSLKVNAFHSVDQYDRTRMVYGIDCQRCHGPAAAHVQYQQEHPEDKTARFIARWDSLTRQQRVDVCGVCHSGAHGFTRAVFGFRPGDTLTQYFYPEIGNGGNTNAMDVHGNQYGLLLASKCFLQSKTMECVTCHDPHGKDQKSLADYSAKCMSCHQPQQVQAVHPRQDTAVLMSNCIDCHMPVGESKLITIQRDAGKDVMAHLARRHLIGVYGASAAKQ